MPEYRCKKCGKSFPSNKALANHVKDKHASVYYARKIATLIVIIAIVAGAGYGMISWQRPTRTISGIPCDTLEQTNYHIHAKLEIYVDGVEKQVPRNIGIIPGVCSYWVHTHRDPGIIHIEAPDRRTFTLGQFFDVWGQPLSRSAVWDVAIDEGKELRVYVDGELYLRDPRSIELLDNRVITLDIGPPFKNAS